MHVVARSATTALRAEEGNADSVVPAVEDLPFVDGIVVATPSSVHAETLKEVVGLEAPVFIEKPMTTDSGSAIRFAKEGRERLFVMDKWRYHPGVEALRQILQSGELGDFRELRTWRTGRGSRRDTDAVWHLLPHDLSIAYEITGDFPEPESAQAETQKAKPWALSVRFKNRIMIKLSEASPRKRKIRLVGSLGSATLSDPYAEYLEIRTRKGTRPRLEARKISKEMPLKRELRAFVDFLRGGPPPRSSAEEGACAVVLIERIRRMAGLQR